jgi:hypothetical protein
MAHSHKVRDEVARLAMAATAWSQPSPLSAEGGGEHSRLFPGLRYPTPFDFGVAGAEKWSVGLKARAGASNRSVAAYKASATPLPADLQLEYNRIWSAIKSLKRVRVRARRRVAQAAADASV